VSVAGGTTRRASSAEVTGAALLAAAGLAVLVLRPELVSNAPHPVAALLVCYAGLLGVGLAGPQAPPVPGTEAAPSGRAAVLAVGLGAVTVARLLEGPGLALGAGMAGVALNTVAAVSEEALFRRFVYGWLALGGTALAVVGSALLFAFVHVPGYGPAALPVDVGAGLLLSWQRWACGDWRIPAATHVAANLLAVLR